MRENPMEKKSDYWQEGALVDIAELVVNRCGLVQARGYIGLE